jgi:hypothetical protein
LNRATSSPASSSSAKVSSLQHFGPSVQNTFVALFPRASLISRFDARGTERDEGGEEERGGESDSKRRGEENVREREGGRKRVRDREMNRASSVGMQVLTLIYSGAQADTCVRHQERREVQHKEEGDCYHQSSSQMRIMCTCTESAKFLMHILSCEPKCLPMGMQINSMEARATYGTWDYRQILTGFSMTSRPMEMGARVR